MYSIIQGVKGTSGHIDGLILGHHYMILVETWNASGEGNPVIARSVVPGAATPPVPTGITVTSTDATTVQVSWTGSGAAAGYRVWTRNINDATSVSTPGDIVGGTSSGIAFLFPGVWNFQFCVSALNGDLESAKSTCVTAPRPAGS